MTPLRSTISPRAAGNADASQRLVLLFGPVIPAAHHLDAPQGEKKHEQAGRDDRSDGSQTRIVLSGWRADDHSNPQAIRA